MSTAVQFKRLLELILAVGNYLNGGSSRGILRIQQTQPSRILDI